MKNPNSVKHSLFIGLMLFALVSITNAQGVDLKEIGAEKQTESIKKFTDLLTDFYAHLFQAIGDRSKSISNGKVAGAGLTDKATKIRGEVIGNVDNIQSLIAKFKTANRYNEQFDKDAIKLLGSNKAKSQLAKSGGSRKLLESVLNSNATNNLKKNVSESAALVEFKKDEDVCRFIAVGILVEVLFSKKSTTTSDKIYEANGCHK